MLERYGFKSRFPSAMLARATQAAEDEPDGGDPDSELADYVNCYADTKLDDPAFEEIIRWGFDTFGECPECKRMLSYEDNAWAAQWVGEGTYCSYDCVEKVTSEVINDLINQMEKWYARVTPMEDWELSPELRKATFEHITSGDYEDRYRSEADVEEDIKTFWDDYDYHPYIHPKDQGEPWVV